MTDFTLAPDFAPTLNWVNGPAPRLMAWRGRVVAVVFWHAGSATSVNLLADLAQLQARYADGLSLVGIHTPKFDAQRESDLVARAVNQLGIRFSVANDADAVVWQHYGIRAWPSVALIDAEGQLVEIIAGDQQFEVLDERIHALLDEAGARGLRIYENAQPVQQAEPMSPVLFPRGLALTDQRLYVSDSGHHRVLECDLDGHVLRVFGSGTAGFVNGLGSQAAFHSPCGLALDNDTLYVADTGNHAVRRIRLKTGDVDTLIGKGQGGVPQTVEDVRKAAVVLDQPVGIAVDGRHLYVSLAASNQIWVLSFEQHSFRLLAGSGRLALDDGEGALASFAQPMGLALLSTQLFIVDAQASAIRKVNVRTGKVETLLGQGVFDFGNEEGDRESALLQYPLGVTTDPRAAMLWIADTYNNAIGAWHLEGGGLVRFPLPHPLCRPSAMVSDGSRLWIANTDAHEVVRMDFSTGQADVLPMTQ